MTGFLIHGCFLAGALFLAACAGDGGPADAETRAALLLHGPQGAEELESGDGCDALLAELNSLLTGSLEPLFLALEPAALEIGRQAGALELRYAEEREFPLFGGGVISAHAVMLLLGDDPAAEAAGAGCLAVFLGEDENDLIEIRLAPLSRVALRHAVERVRSNDK